MRKRSRQFLCILLSLALPLYGCSAVRTRYGPYPGGRSALEVVPYWQDSSGSRHLVLGAKIRLLSTGGAFLGPTLEAETDGDGAPTFSGLAPGRYVLTVDVEGTRCLSREVELRLGKRLTVEFNAASEAPQGFDDAVVKVAGGFVEVVKTIVVIAGFVALGAIYLYVEAHQDEHEDDRQFH